MTATEPRQAAGPASSGEALTHRQVMAVLGGLLLCVFLSAVDATIVSTALPTIAGELGGLNRMSWVVTAYLLTSTAATPLFGKVSDLYGRQRILQIALVIFLGGSMLCGAAQSITQLVLARALQGIGGGGLQALAFVVLGDILSPRERGRYMGYFTGTFALSGLAGPLLGGLVVDTGALGWRWIFYLNLPLGIVAAFVTVYVLRLLPVHRTEAPHRLGGLGHPRGQRGFPPALRQPRRRVRLRLAQDAGGGCGRRHRRLRVRRPGATGVRTGPAHATVQGPGVRRRHGDGVRLRWHPDVGQRLPAAVPADRGGSVRHSGRAAVGPDDGKPDRDVDLLGTVPVLHGPVQAADPDRA